MNATITIHTQYQENYSDSTTPHWKNKGGQTFTVEINTDILMYGTDDLVPHLNTLLAAQSNEHSNYIYVSHEVRFVEVVELSQATLEASIQKEYGQREEEKSEALYGDC
jgi:hypothetical protein